MHQKAVKNVSLTRVVETSWDDAFWDDALRPLRQFAQPCQISKDIDNLPLPSRLPDANPKGRPFNAEPTSLSVDERPPLMSG